MRGINKVSPVDEYELYLSGLSITEIHAKTSIPLSTLRNRFLRAGILRSRGDGVRNAAQRGLLGKNKGIKRTFSEAWRANISRAQKKLAEINSNGVDTSKGYARFTRGANKGKFVHKYVMELWLGRSLIEGECVHHIDGNKLNNDINNLALLTTSGHARLHRYEDEISGKTIHRNMKGEFTCVA